MGMVDKDLKHLASIMLLGSRLTSRQPLNLLYTGKTPNNAQEMVM
jgi:hypothetical protein